MSTRGIRQVSGGDSPLTRRLLLGALAVSMLVAGNVTRVTLADPLSPMTIVDVDSPDPVASGELLTYTITMVNTGGSKLTNVVMTDQLNGVGGIGVPPQLQISSTRGSCTQTTTLVTCSGGSIPGSGQWVVTIKGKVTAASGAVINNTASVTGTRSAQNFNTTTTTTTTVAGGSGSPLPDLTINKNGPSSVAPSGLVTYTLTVNNIGTANATNVKVVDTVPSVLTGVSATGTSLFSCSVSGSTVTCLGGAVNQGANATITVTGTAPASGSFTNTASVDPDNTIPEGNELNNTSALVNTTVTTPPTPPLSIDKTDGSEFGSNKAAWPAWAKNPDAGPDPVNPGQSITYKIIVTNTSNQRADDVIVVDGTQGLVASSIQVSNPPAITNGTLGTGNGCVVDAPQIRCRVRTLNPGGTIVIGLSGQVIESAGSTIINTATVTGNIKNTGYSATDTELTTVKPAIDLTITKSASPNPVCAASWPGTGYNAGAFGIDYPAGSVCQGGLTYTFVVGNSGMQTASNVVVRDPLPAGVIFDHALLDAGPFTCDYVSGVVTCTIPTIGPESTRTLQFVSVAPPSVGAIVNTVSVDPANAIFESDETNNTFTQTTQVSTGVDLFIAKHSNHEADYVATRGTLTYQIAVSSLGTQDASGIVVRDTLPADTVFRDATTDGAHNFSCSAANGFVTCTGGVLKGTESLNYPNLLGKSVDTALITIRVFATAYEQAAMHNEVRVDPAGQIPEADESNNLAVQDTLVKRAPAGEGTAHHAFNQLTIAMQQVSPDPSNTARNAVVTYVIHVGNDGTDPVSNVKLIDTMPAGARFIEATSPAFNCLPGEGTFVCLGGTIPASTPTASGPAITVTMFAPDTPGTYTNQAEVDPDHAIAEGNEFDNTASAQTVVTNGGAHPFYELSVDKTQTSPLPRENTARNAVVTYSIVVRNVGSDAVNGVAVRDKLPAGARYIQATGDHQFLCSEQLPGIVNCVNGQLSGKGSDYSLPDGIATITLKMFAPDMPGVYSNQVAVDPDDVIPEGNEFNNLDAEDTTVVNGGNGAFNDLQIEKTATALTTPGGPIVYTIHVWNTGSDPAMNVAVRDALPAGVIFDSAASDGAPGGFFCVQAGGVVNCTGATVAGGTTNASGFRTITIHATAPQDMGAYLNTAVVDPDNTVPEGDESNNTSSANTDVSSKINLTVSKSGPRVATQASTATYDIKVKNNAINGGQSASGIELHDPMPVGLIPLTSDTGTGNNWSCQIAFNPINVVDCVGDLGAGEEVSIQIKVFITAESGGVLDNVACVDPDNLIVESSEADNCSQFSSTVGAAPKYSPDLLVTKAASATHVTGGELLHYDVTISNVGMAKAMSPLTLTDVLPASVTYISHTNGNDFACTESSGTLTCHDTGTGLAVGAFATIGIDVQVKPDVASAIINAATAAKALVDPLDSLCAIDPSTCEDETADHMASNTASVFTSVSNSTGYDFAITALTDAPDPVTAGNAVVYTIVAANVGTQDTPVGDPVHVGIDLPPSTSAAFIGADGSNGFTCGNPVSNHVDCSGDLPAGGTTTITVKMGSIVAAPPTLTLVATIDPSLHFDELTEANNSMTEVTTVSNDVCGPGCVDIVASQMLPSVEPVYSGQEITFLFSIVNSGDQPANFGAPEPPNSLVNPFAWFDIQSSDAVFTLVSRTSSNPAVTCTTHTSSLTNLESDCVIDHTGGAGDDVLNPGEGVAIAIKVQVAATGANPTVSASGTADPLGVVTEFLETNNSLVRTVTIIP